MTNSTNTYKNMSQQAAEIIAQQLQRKPNSCLALPTGRTPLGTYAILAKQNLNWSQATCFILDNYLEGPLEQRFDQYMERELFCHTNLPNEQRFHPGLIDNYDGKIASSGGIDLAVLGLGPNGHIAFNEPGTPLQSWTHCVYLTESTRQSITHAFADKKQVPHRAITMGISTIMASRAVLLMVSGSHKKEILHQALYESPTKLIPASFLAKHTNLTVLTDF